MRKTLLIATVAALAITAPAEAERGGRGDRPDKAQQAQAQGGGQRAERRANAQQRSFEPRAERRAQAQPGGFERRTQAQQGGFERRAMRQQQASERRAMREQPAFERRARVQQQAAERRAVRQQQMIEHRGRAQQAAAERRARSQQLVEHRRREQQAVERRARVEQQQVDRRAWRQQAVIERRAEVRQDRRAQLRDFSGEQRVAAERRDTRGFASLRRQAWEQRADRLRVLGERRERLRDAVRARFADKDRDEFRARRLFSVGQRVDPSWWYDDYVPLRSSSNFFDNDDFYYRYDGDYIYRLRRDDDVVLSLFPLLGGAYAVGQPLPFYTNSFYNVPLGYSSLYYDTPDSYYRYGDGAIYQVDPTTQLIAGIVALLTGQNFGIGQRLPLGYDVYNVPYAYRSTYYDTPDMWYRYDDGYIYGVDPYTRIVESRYPVYAGYAVGSPWPTYAGYDYAVPGHYDDLYYADPRYDYRYASGGVYAVDPKTQLVAALAALVTGQNFAVGQRLPLGYDVYNVPLGYRADYFDTPDVWYRYADGRVYQVDPGTRIIQRVILV